ncbi:hypothetical protein Back11_03940 [Paenibacillus baekrokdamisoli]|uniref:Uncharacterized protein n=1 Tax=Paenibacillus baekrokdamisoli TaxID=1712516 RepID=A0A3G9J7T2_9BACL|nr:transglutaminase-like domain-containing protein [Paenibacillus baekrokdamisoli]MBB3067769.1 transglutaminase-like putative cysteine protease [Paenibacillus baekrokdamisoli]BBH19049.1 hypothetical protein Back11_03940 [Paenibacillus baekrokdamisoli]
MRRFTIMLLALLVTVGILPMSVTAADELDSDWLDTSKLNKGTIGIRYDAPSDKITKVIISKGGSSYTYDLDKAKESQPLWLPLQMGNGVYSIAILENVKSNKYRSISAKTITVKVSNATDLYLNSIQNVNWMDATKAVAKAKELTRGSKTEEEKVKAIYQYIIGNVKYDNALAGKVTLAYIPDIDNTLTTGKGICYGYASLFAAMLRSSGVPTKLVMGTTTMVAVYHAWNEVYLNGKWMVVDTTVDAALKKAGKTYSFEKLTKNYKAEKTY